MSFSQGFTGGFGIVTDALNSNARRRNMDADSERQEAQNAEDARVREELMAARDQYLPAPSATGQTPAQQASQGAVPNQQPAQAMPTGEVAASVAQPAGGDAGQSQADLVSQMASSAGQGGSATGAQPRGATKDEAGAARLLLQQVKQVGGIEGAEAPTRQDWNAYLQAYTRAYAGSADPQKMGQALGNVEKIRTAGVQQGTALAIAAADAGDLDGAAKAMNYANQFMPDGYHTTFAAGEGGLTVTRTPDHDPRQGQQQGQMPEGQQAQTFTIPRDKIRTMALNLFDPKFTQELLLGERKQTEVERSNVADERLKGMQIDVQREGVAVQRAGVGVQAAGLALRREQFNDERSFRDAQVKMEREATAATGAEELATRNFNENPTPENKQALNDASVARIRAESGLGIQQRSALRGTADREARTEIAAQAEASRAEIARLKEQRLAEQDPLKQREIEARIRSLDARAARATAGTAPKPWTPDQLTSIDKAVGEALAPGITWKAPNGEEKPVPDSKLNAVRAFMPEFAQANPNTSAAAMARDIAPSFANPTPEMRQRVAEQGVIVGASGREYMVGPQFRQQTQMHLEQWRRTNEANASRNTATPQAQGLVGRAMGGTVTIPPPAAQPSAPAAAPQAPRGSAFPSQGNWGVIGNGLGGAR